MAISETFKINAEFYKRGKFELIEWHDPNTNELFKFHPKQVQALQLFTDQTTTYVGYGGAARGGKSALLCAAPIFESYIYAGSRYLLGRKDLTLLWGTTWKTLLKLLDMFGFVVDEDYKFNGKNYEMTFNNGSQIIAKNLELKPSDPEGTAFGSLEITKALIDQSENVNLTIVNKIGERVGSHVAVKYNLKGKVMEAFNPTRTHVYRRYWKPFRDNFETVTKKFVRALPSDNPGKEAVKWVEERIADYRDGSMSEIDFQKQIKGNFDYDDDATNMVNFEQITDLFSNSHVERGQKYITADIAAQGSDTFKIYVWEGMRVIDIHNYAKSDAFDVINAINLAKNQYSVPNSKIIFDSDGVGALLRGKPLPNAVSFNANSKPLESENNDDDKKKENYENLKTQLAYKLAEAIRKAEIFIEYDVSEVERDQIEEELSQLKTRDSEKDGKLKMIRKEQMKKNLGRSPDHLDNFIMRMYFEIKQTKVFKYYAAVV